MFPSVWAIPRSRSLPTPISTSRRAWIETPPTGSPRFCFVDRACTFKLNFSIVRLDQCGHLWSAGSFEGTVLERRTAESSTATGILNSGPGGNRTLNLGIKRTVSAMSRCARRCPVFPFSLALGPQRRILVTGCFVLWHGICRCSADVPKRRGWMLRRSRNSAAEPLSRKGTSEGRGCIYGET